MSEKKSAGEKCLLNRLRVCLLFVFLFVAAEGIFVNKAEAADISDAQTGNWNATATWTGGVVPVAGDNVTIDTGTVTLTADAACADITIGSGGTLDASSYTITVSGNWDSSGGTFTYGTSTVVMTGSTKTMTAGSSSYDFYNLTINSGASITDNYGLDIKAGGLLTVSGTFTVASGKWLLIRNTANMTINSGGTLTITGGIISYTAEGNTGTFTNDGTIDGGGTWEWGIKGVQTTGPVAAIDYGNLRIFFSTYAPAANSTAVLSAGTLTTTGALDIYDDRGNGASITINNSTNNATVNAGSLTIGNTTSRDSRGTLIAGSATYTITGNVVTAADGWDVSSDLQANTATFNVGGNWTNNGIFTADTSTVTFDGTADQTVTSGGSSFYNLTLNNTGASGSDDILLADALDVNNNLLITDGDLDTTASNYAVDVDGNLTIGASGSLTANGSTITVSGNWDSSAGTFTEGTSNVILTGTGNVNISASDYFYDVTMAQTGQTTTLLSSILTNNTLTLGSGGTLTGSGKLLQFFKNGGTPLVNNGAAVSVGLISYEPTSGTVTVAGGTYTVRSGWGFNLYAKGSDVTFNIASDLTINTNTYMSISADDGLTNTTVNFQNGSTFTIDQMIIGGSTTSGPVTINFGSSIIDLNGTLVVFKVNLNGGSHQLNLQTSTVASAGSWLMTNVTLDPGTSTFTFDGTATGNNITLNGGSFYDLIINGSGGGWTMQDALTVDNDLTVTAGTLDIAAKDITVTADLLVNGGTLDTSDSSCDLDVNGNLTVSSGTLSAPAVADDTSFTVAGNWKVFGTGTFTANSGRVLFDAGVTGKIITASSSNADDFYDVKFNNASGGWTMQDALTVDNDLTLTAGTFSTSASDYALVVTGDVDIDGTFIANGSTVTVAGNWDSSAGTFTFGTSTLVMTGTNKNLTYKGGWGSPRLYNLTIGTGASITGLKNGGGGPVLIANNIVLEANATFTPSGSYWLWMTSDGGNSAGGDLTLDTGATLTINNTDFIRFIDDSSNHISTAGTINGTGYFQYSVISGSTAAPITARVYDCDMGMNAPDASDIGVLGGGTSLNLGTKTLYVYDRNLNIGFYGILDNSVNNIAITAGSLIVGHPSYAHINGKLICGSGTIDIDGDVVIANTTTASEIDADTSSWTVSGDWTNGDTFTADSSTVDFDASSGTQTLNSGGTGANQDFNNFAHSGAGTLDIVTNDVDINGTFTNSGTLITETTGNLIIAAASCLLTNSSGSEVSEYIIGTDSIYVRVVDEDENLDGTSADTLTGVTVTGGTNGDSETLSLTETGNATEIFLSSALTTAGYDGSASANDGTLELSAGETITVAYIDSEDNTDNNASDTATCRLAIANFLVSASSPQVAGTAFDVTITAREADGTTDIDFNRTANITLTYVTPSSGTKTLSTASTSSFTNGVATVSETYTDAGIVSITATDSSDSTIYGTTSNITFVPDSFSVSASKSTIVVNEPFTLTLTAKNTAGNTTANYQDKATLSINYVTPSADQNGTLSTTALTSSDWSSGIAALSSFTYNKFGIITITCTDPTDTTQTGTSSNITFFPLELKVEPVSPSGGRDFYYQDEEITATVTAKDYNGSTVGNYTGDVNFSGENLNLPAAYSFTPFDSGIHIFSGLSGTAAGTTSITATDAAYSAATGTSSQFTVKEGTIIVRDTSGPVGPLTITVDLIDSDGYDITTDSGTTFTVILTESRDDDTTSCAATKSAVTFENGTAEIEVTDTQAEVVTVTPVSEDYLNIISGKVTFGGAGVPSFGSGFRIKWWRELRNEE